jgi:hypothetical protein
VSTRAVDRASASATLVERPMEVLDAPWSDTANSTSPASPSPPSSTSWRAQIACSFR